MLGGACFCALCPCKPLPSHPLLPDWGFQTCDEDPDGSWGVKSSFYIPKEPFAFMHPSSA